MIIDWSEEKNKELQIQRGVSFEDIMLALEEKRVLYAGNHPNIKKYPNQRAFIVQIDNYAYLVPYVTTGDKIFLKTIYPSRKLTKKYLSK